MNVWRRTSLKTATCHRLHPTSWQTVLSKYHWNSAFFLLQILYCPWIASLSKKYTSCAYCESCWAVMRQMVQNAMSSYCLHVASILWPLLRVLTAWVLKLILYSNDWNVWFRNIASLWHAGMGGLNRQNASLTCISFLMVANEMAYARLTAGVNGSSNRFCEVVIWKYGRHF